MDQSRISALIATHATVGPSLHGLVKCLCVSELIHGLSEEHVVERIRAIAFFHKASEPGDDDEYWACCSPFDSLWYLFVASPIAAMPTKPYRVQKDPPDWVTQDM
jgi:hypothetical protein